MSAGDRAAVHCSGTRQPKVPPVRFPALPAARRSRHDVLRVAGVAMVRPGLGSTPFLAGLPTPARPSVDTATKWFGRRRELTAETHVSTGHSFPRQCHAQSAPAARRTRLSPTTSGLGGRTVPPGNAQAGPGGRPPVVKAKRKRRGMKHVRRSAPIVEKRVVDAPCATKVAKMVAGSFARPWAVAGGTAIASTPMTAPRRTAFGATDLDVVAVLLLVGRKVHGSARSMPPTPRKVSSH